MDEISEPVAAPKETLSKRLGQWFVKGLAILVVWVALLALSLLGPTIMGYPLRDVSAKAIVATDVFFVVEVLLLSRLAYPRRWLGFVDYLVLIWVSGVFGALYSVYFAYLIVSRRAFREAERDQARVEARARRAAGNTAT